MRISPLHIAYILGVFAALPAYAKAPARGHSHDAVAIDVALRVSRDADAVWQIIAEHAAEHRIDAPGWPCSEDRQGKVLLALRAEVQMMASAASALPIKRAMDCDTCVACADCPERRSSQARCLDCRFQPAA
ncbi:MAG: hypothetical protein IPN84_16915 [Sphingomonadales bacterium]|nr:hypothetical protein [Sphingomonadales bacterium]